MLFDLAIIGFGVIGVETLHGIKKILKRKKLKKKIHIAIIEKDFTNVPGGVAYSKKKSKFGYFNNPLRLSHPDFIRWFKQKKNRNLIINFSKNNKSYNLAGWLKNNEFSLNQNFKDYKEIYLPRLIYSFYLKEKIIDFLNFKKKLKIVLKFYQGELVNLKKIDNFILLAKKNFAVKNPNYNQNKLEFKNKKSPLISKLIAKNVILGTGLVPPMKIKEITNYQNNNYIWDFYTSGGTNNLIKKINLFLKKKKNIKLVFIGNKAGLLETMQEIEKLIIKNKALIKILCISKNSLTLQKAERSKKFSQFKYKFFVKKNIQKISKAEEIYEFLKKEFYSAKKLKFNKYDVWTNILKDKIMTLCYNRLSQKEKKIYNQLIFPLIRSKTRYTYPETVSAKNRLSKKKKIKFIKDKVILITKNKHNISLKTKNNKSITGDIVINVSGPVSIIKNKEEIKVVSAIKKITNNFNETGFTPNNNFMLENGLFTPGTLANNFNPGRQTIIRAITNNAHKVSKKILK